MKSYLELIQFLQTDKFWGEVTLYFKDGQVTLIEKKQQIKFENQRNSLSRNNHLELHVQTEGRHELCDRKDL